MRTALTVMAPLALRGLSVLRDRCRTSRFAIWGGLFGSPAGHLWYGLLDRTVLPGNPRSPRRVVARSSCHGSLPRLPSPCRAIAAKIALDQLAYTPVIMAAFFCGQKVLEGEPEAIEETLRDKLWPTLLAGWSIWPFAHVLNFALVPTRQRILFINVVSVAWVAVLSQIASTPGRGGSTHSSRGTAL